MESTLSYNPWIQSRHLFDLVLKKLWDNIGTNYLHKFSKKVRIYKKKSEFTALVWLKKLHSAIAGRRDQNNKYLLRQSRLLISPEFLKNSDAVCNIPWIPSRNVEKHQMDFCMYTVSEFFKIFFQEFQQKFLMKFRSVKQASSSTSVWQRMLLQGPKSTGNFGLVIKGQWISEVNFLVLIWTKKLTKLFFDFCPKDLK